MMQLLHVPLVLVFLLSSLTHGDDSDFTDLSTDLWRAANTAEHLSVCAGVDEEGNLLLVTYDVIHMLPSSRTANDGGARADPTLRKRSSRGIRIQTVEGRPLSIEQFRKRFSDGRPNASRIEKGRVIREFHSLVLLLEHGFPVGKHRETPSYFHRVFRPDMPVVSIPSEKGQATEARQALEVP